MNKKQLEKFNTIYVLFLFFVGIFLSIVSKTIFDNGHLFYAGLGMVSVALAISLFEVFGK